MKERPSRTQARAANMEPVHTDNWNNVVEFGNNYIQYRSRVLDYGAVNTFCVKNKRLLINFYAQNAHLPTMCVIFKSKEDAEAALASLKDHMFFNTNDESILNRLRRLLGI